MNAVTEVNVCEQSLLKGLLEHMRRVLQNTKYISDEERLRVLAFEYREHLYIKGTFELKEDALIFCGVIAGIKTEIRSHK